MREREYLIGYATERKEGKVERTVKYLIPTAKNIANFIMNNRFAEVVITDELDLPVLTATHGMIFDCPDQDFLIKEIHPAIIPMQMGEEPVGEVEEFEF